MPSTISAVRDLISQDIEALTPPTDSTVTYHQVETETALEGSAARRAFFQSPPTGGTIIEQGDSAVWQYTWSLTLVLTALGETIPTLFDSIADEALLISKAIYSRSNWGSNNVREVICEGWSLSTEDGEEIEIIFRLRAQVIED